MMPLSVVPQLVSLELSANSPPASFKKKLNKKKKLQTTKTRPAAQLQSGFNQKPICFNFTVRRVLFVTESHLKPV